MGRVYAGGHLTLALAVLVGALRAMTSFEMRTKGTDSDRRSFGYPTPRMLS